MSNEIIIIEIPSEEPATVIELESISSYVDGTNFAGILPIDKGGTNASTVNEARTNLSIYSKAEVDLSLGNKVDFNDSRLTDSRHPLNHQHSISDITSLQANLNSKSNVVHTHVISDITGLQTEINSKENVGVAATLLSTHETSANHPTATSFIKGMMSASDKSKLDGIAINATANQSDFYLLSRTNHTGSQSISTITGLQSALDSKVDDTDLSNYYLKTEVDSAIANATPADATNTVKGVIRLTGDLSGTADSPTVPGLATKADLNHTHTASQITDFSEAVDDEVANLLIDSTSIDFTYNDAANTLTANVLPAGIDKNSLGGSALSIANGGTGSATQNFVDLSTAQTVAGNKSLSGILNITNNTASTSTTTGALTVAGGVGVAGSLNIGNTILQQTNIATIGSTIFEVINSGISRTVLTNNGTQQWDLRSGVSTEVGRITYSTPGNNPGIIIFTGADKAQNRFNVINAGSHFTLGFNSDSSTASTFNIIQGSGGFVGLRTTTPGCALQVTGGVAITSSTTAVTNPGDGNLSVLGTTASTSSTTGALKVAGGVGVAGNLNVGGITTSGSYRVSALNTPPASSTDTGTTGEIRVTSTHIFVCVATNTWVRTALTTW